MQNKANLGQNDPNLHDFSAHRFWPKIFPRTIFYIKMSGNRPKMGERKGGTHPPTVFKTGGKNDESKNSPKHRQNIRNYRQNIGSPNKKANKKGHTTAIAIVWPINL